MNENRVLFSPNRVAVIVVLALWPKGIMVKEPDAGRMFGSRWMVRKILLKEYINE
jgi:hypothetical protein